ncbi:g2730 [Coccomyxa elongata]
MSEEETDPEYVVEVAVGGSDSASFLDDDDDIMTDDEDSDEETEVRISFLSTGAARMQRRMRLEGQLSKLQRVPDDPTPLQQHINDLVKKHSCAFNPRHRLRMGKGVGEGIAKLPAMLRLREANMLGINAGFSAPQRCHMGAHLFRPDVPIEMIDRMQSRAYIGQFSADGDVFVAAFQHDRRIRLYETENNWRLRKDVHCRNLRWTVTDTCLSPDQQFLLYASINPTVHMVNMRTGGVESEANVTDIHEALHFDVMEERDSGYHHSFGIWSLRWGSDGREIVAGTGDHSLYVYNVERQKTVLRITGHQDDVNAVAFLDGSSHLIASGSDDTLIKVWDRRALGRGAKPAGVLVGHSEGLTHLDSKGDGRYLLSNSKDQTARLWDIRKMYSAQEYNRLPRPNIPSFGNWDYRWADFPARGYIVPHPHDVSVQAFRGHSVLQTLIRAYFSPAHSTGQRYVYTGSADGSVRIYDIVTGRTVDQLRYHHEIVRDLSWHPTEPMLVTTSFDGSVVQWEPRRLLEDSESDEEAGEPSRPIRRRALPDDPGDDRLEDFY